MGKDLYDAHSSVRDLFTAATAAAPFDVADLVFNGSAEDLQATDKAQIAITVVNLAAAVVLQEAGLAPAATAGFSLGEYAAMVTARVLTLKDALRCVQVRGSIMEEVSRQVDTDGGKSGMCAVIGLSADEVSGCVQDNNKAFVAIKNSPVQTVVGGTREGLEAATQACKDAGARRVVPLRVSGPFHTSFMEDAYRQYSKELERFVFSDPKIPIYSNVTAARVGSGEDMRVFAGKQLVSIVEWVAEQRAVLKDNSVRGGGTSVCTLLEVGPGSVLQGLWKGLAKQMQEEDTQVVLPACMGAGKLEEINTLTKS